jgi:hypothetical protein
LEEQALNDENNELAELEAHEQEVEIENEVAEIDP